MSWWDDISESLSEISIDDVTGLVNAYGNVKNQGQEVVRTQAAQSENYTQPEHGTTADGRPILAGGNYGVMPWYQDPLKVGAATVIVGGLLVLVVKAVK